MERYWTTKDKKKVKYSDLEDDHLSSIINWIERQAEKGEKQCYGGGGGDDFYYEEDVITGNQVLEKYDHQGLCMERMERRVRRLENEVRILLSRSCLHGERF